MMNNKRFAVIAIVAALLLGMRFYRTKAVGRIAAQRTTTADFVCDGNRTIHAVFHNGKEPSVELQLSDGRKLVLPQTPAASGARYATAGESVVFWTKGDTAFIEENGKETYANGKQVAGK
jgi:membrane-bound inhibitor of C-type lysozyme